MKHKCPHLLKPLGTINRNKYWSFYPSEAFSFDQFTLIHPVIPLPYFDKAFFFKKKELKRIAMPLLTTIKRKTQGPCSYLNECKYHIICRIRAQQITIYTMQKKFSIIKPTHKRQLSSHHRLME